MKKLFVILGGICLVIILAISGIRTFTWYQASKYEDTAVPYINAAVPQLSKWNPELIKKYMVREVLEETTDEDFSKIISYLSKLGGFIAMEEPSFKQIYTGATLASEKQTLVTYTVDAVYENGDAEVTMVLLDLGTSFQVYKFNIRSMALAE